MKRVFLCAALAAYTPVLYAATFVVPSDRDLVRRADAIVVATVQRSFAQYRDNRLETVTALDVGETIKGFVPEILEVHEPGGELAGRAEIIPGVPRFQDGDRVLLFLRRAPDGTWAVADIALGHFTFAEDIQGQRLLVRAASDVVGWDPDGKPHAEPRREADRFLDFVRLVARGARAVQNYEVPWSPLATPPQPGIGSRIRANAVQALATFSATSYTYEINGTGSAGARWNVFPSAVAFYTGSGASGSQVTSTQAAIASWDNDCPSNINYSYGGNDPCSPSCHTSGLAASDGLNTVLFERDLSQYGIAPFSCSGNSYSGTLGIGGVTSASGQHAGPNGETFWTTHEGDVEMNRGVLACTALGSNLNSAVTHEVGHTLGFRHSDQTRADNPSVPCANDPSLECTSSAIMNSFVPNGLNGALQPWDQHAAGAVYPGGSCTPPPPPPPSSTSVIRDLNGDGNSDLLFRNTQTGEAIVWFMNGTGHVSTASLGVVPLNYKLACAGDFNGDGFTDLIWHDPNSGVGTIWHMRGATLLSSLALPQSPSGWAIEGCADFNHDGHVDLLFHDHSTGYAFIWFMNDYVKLSQQAVVRNVDPVNWHMVGAGDFDGDGNFDILWRNFVFGTNTILHMNGASGVSNISIGTVDINYEAAAIADFNHDGVSDIFWRHKSTGGNAFYFMRNSTVFATVATEAIPAPWSGSGPR
jgi:hypothetical protein